MTDFPDIKRLDGATFNEEFEDVSIPPGEMEGGYQNLSSRFTRDPRRTFSWRFTDMTDDDKTALEDFWKLVKGRSNAFNWTHPMTDEVINVRFGEMKMVFKRIPFIPRWETDTVVVVEV